MTTLLLTPREELLWLAALLDGEGCFSLNGRYPNIILGMTDEDIVRTAHKRAGVGNVTGPHEPENPKHKRWWKWKVSDREHVFQLCRALLPYMSERRAKKIQEILRLWKPSPEPIWVRLDRWDNT